MNYKKIIKNTDVLCGLNGLKNLLQCTWCVESKREMVLEYIANTYGFVSLELKKDMDALPSLIKEIEVGTNSSSSVDRVKMAKEHKTSISKVKPIGKNKYIINGKVYESSE